MTPGTVTPTPEPRPHQLPAGLTVSLTECVLGRDQFACLRCGDSVLQAAWTLHWRTRRHPTTTPQALILCAHCDHDVQAHRRRSIRLGYLIPAGNFNPSAIPVLHHRNGWVVLTQDGKWAKADEFAVRDWQARWPEKKAA